ncbi:recombination protein RecR [Candidatus Dependentiae bacterium Noda2021]|nr:recombination protein RecR [Candidatus Dependentiae bacterium Noda2021]
MLNEVPQLAQLLKLLQQVPYLASKNIYRVANYFLTLDNHKMEQFCGALLDLKSNISKCPVCYMWCTKGKACSLCSSLKRDQSLVCVVESWHEMLMIEKTGGYKGVYHILGGLICPLEGIGPDQLTIMSLVKRVESGTVKEIILATSQTPEGEATSSYIASKLKMMPVIISCLARGIPVGSSIESMDRLTVYKALSERRPF